jgi:hypothetical protein
MHFSLLSDAGSIIVDDKELKSGKLVGLHWHDVHTELLKTG